MKFGMIRGLANRHLFPEFGELWPTFPGGIKFVKADISQLLLERDEIWQRYGWNVLRDFGEL